MKVFESLDELRAAVGARMGPTDWLLVDQARIDRFTEATGERQWIHDDDERTWAESPFGGPIAQGDLTLSLSNLFLPQLMQVRGVSAGVNYGTGRIRFPAPVPAGARLRASAELTACEEISGGVQTTVRVTIEVEGNDKPACVVEALSRWLA